MYMSERWLFISITLIILIGIIIPVFLIPVFGDEIKYIGTRIESDNPLVCVFEPGKEEIRFHDRHILLAAVHSVKSWQIELNRYTDSKDWNIGIQYIENKTHFDKEVSDYKQCDIFMVFNINNSSSAQLGYTSFDYSKSSHKYAFITVFTDSNPNSIQIDDFVQIGEGEWTFEIRPQPLTLDGIGTIIKHELGHALGLEHKYKTLTNNFDSLMAPTFNPGSDNQPDITEHDLAALVKLYGKDGFKKYYNTPRPSPYQP